MLGIHQESRHPSASCYSHPHLLTVSACGIASSLCACSNTAFDFQLTLPFQPCYRFTNLHSGTLHVQYTNLHGGTQPVHKSLIYSTHPPLRLLRPTTLTNISAACISIAKVDGAWLTQSPASRSFHGSAYVTPLPSQLRRKKE